MTRTKLLVEKNQRRAEIRSKVIAFTIYSILIVFGTVMVSLGVKNVLNAGNIEPKIDKQYIDYCEEIGEKYHIAPSLLIALIEHESGGNPNATGSVGEQGLCQIIPKYQKARMKKLGITNLYDPYSNILCSADILCELFEKYGDVATSLVAYNAGEYSKIFKKCLDYGTLTDYARTILNRSDQLQALMDAKG